MTPLRRELLDMLESQQKPLGAYNIAERLSARLKRRIAPAAAYRGLDFLVEMGLVARLECRNAFILSAFPDCLHDCIFLVCKTCDRVEEIVDHDVATLLEDDAKNAGFITERRVIEILGQCKSCLTAENDPPSAMNHRQ